MNNPYGYLKKYEGQNFNYKKEFCPLLQIEYKKNGAKTRQLEQLSQYMELELEYSKITIIKIYGEDELKLIEKRGKYLTHIENFLILLLSEQVKHGYDYSVLTNRNILEMATMVNDNYFRGMGNILPFVDNFDIKMNKNDAELLGYIPEYYQLQKVDADSRLFFSASYRLLKRIVSDCLKNIKNKDLIDYHKTFVCYKLYRTQFGYKTEVVECDNKMIDRIISVRYNSVKEFNELGKNKNGKQEFFLKNADSTYMLYQKQKKQFKDILKYNFQQEFKEEGYTNFSRAWKINLANKEIFQEELNKRHFDEMKLNKNIVDKLIKANDLSSIPEKERNVFVGLFIKK